LKERGNNREERLRLSLTLFKGGGWEKRSDEWERGALPLSDSPCMKH
jgi:hypothetical protein